MNIDDLQIILNWNVNRRNHQLLTGIKLTEQYKNMYVLYHKSHIQFPGARVLLLFSCVSFNPGCCRLLYTWNYKQVQSAE